MKQYAYNDVDALQELVSDEFGPWSEELEVTQELINQFADLTGTIVSINLIPVC